MRLEGGLGEGSLPRFVPDVCWEVDMHGRRIALGLLTETETKDIAHETTIVARDCHGELLIRLDFKHRFIRTYSTIPS